MIAGIQFDLILNNFFIKNKINFLILQESLINAIWFLDERTRGWLLVDSPKPTLMYTILYLLIVWAGPKIMKKRKAFKLTWALVPYNLAMACLNAYISIQVSTSSSSNEKSLGVSSFIYYYVLLSLESEFPLLHQYLSVFFIVICSFDEITI